MPFTPFGLVLRSFLQHPGLPFAQALPEETIKQAFNDEGVSFATAVCRLFQASVIGLWNRNQEKGRA
jgi:hypothetical protein